MTFEFDRYINGQLMAEGVTIERQDNLPAAMREAARIASRGPNGEVPVLILRAETLSRTGAMTEALRDLLDHVDRNTCAHEDTYRGGSIWTICDSCGQKWADDRGGFSPYSDPEPVAKARNALKAAMEAGR